MENTLISIRQRSQEIVSQLMDGIPLSNYDAEMVVLNALAGELLNSIDCNDEIELKKALINMFFLGQFVDVKDK